MIKYFFASIFATLLLGAILAYKYLGFYQPVNITMATSGPYQMIYMDHVGPYHKILQTIETVEKWAKNMGLECKLSVGEYIDDPDMVDHDRLRSRGGCIVENLPETLPKDFKSAEIPKKEYVTATFDGAPSIGPMKVYPRVKDYFREQRLESTGSVFEIYSVQDNDKIRTTYLFEPKTAADTAE